MLQLAAPCKCTSCNNGCKFGSGILAGDDLKNIAKFLGISEEDAKKHYFEESDQFNKKVLKPRLLRDNKPYGKCVFFDEQKGCTIHSVKPLQCKTAMNCKEYGEDLAKWFMVNHIVDPDDPESIRQYAIYLKTHNPIEGAELHNLVKDSNKLKKMLNFEMLR